MFDDRFAPAIALSIVTNMSITSSIFIIGVIVTVYTSLGGLKGVIWTDFFQFSIMMFGMVAVIVRVSEKRGQTSNSTVLCCFSGRRCLRRTGQRLPEGSRRRKD